MNLQNTIKEYNLEEVFADEGNQVWKGHGPHQNETLYVSAQDGEPQVTLTIMPEDHEAVPLIVVFSAWNEAIHELIERWVCE